MMIKKICVLRFWIGVFMAFGILIFDSSCSNKQYQTLFEKKTILTDSAAQTTVVTLDTYRIQPQDILQIRNLQNISYIVDQPTSANGVSGGGAAGPGQTYQVEEDGTVALPMIGHVDVKGLTRSEAQTKVEKLYRDSLLKNPIIELKIVNLKVTILGEIKAQGNYPLIKDKTTLIEILGEAGGLTEKANQTNIEIIRGDAKKPTVIYADLNDMNVINDPKNILQNGDIIYIAENKRAIRTDNIQNFSTIFSPVLLVFNTVLLIFTLARK